MSNRSIALRGFLISTGLLLASFLLQEFAGFVPCPLCLLQRLVLIAVCILFFLGILLASFQLVSRLFAFLGLSLSVTGAALAGRQLWIQHFPPSSPSDCGVGLRYMLEVFPWREVLGRILTGSSDCVESRYFFLKVDIAGWSLLAFSVLICFNFYWLFKSKKKNYFH